MGGWVSDCEVRGNPGDLPEDVRGILELDGPFDLAAVATTVVGGHDDD